MTNKILNTEVSNCKSGYQLFHPNYSLLSSSTKSVGAHQQSSTSITSDKTSSTTDSPILLSLNLESQLSKSLCAGMNIFPSFVNTSTVQIKGEDTFYIQVESHTGLRLLPYVTGRLEPSSSSLPNVSMNRGPGQHDRLTIQTAPHLTSSSVGHMCTSDFTFCQIQVLLVAIQIAVGSTMTGLSSFLWNLSPSLHIADCPFWAAGPLLASGLSGLYFCFPTQYTDRCPRLTKFMQIVGSILAVCNIILGLTASLYSGKHGSWISSHTELCTTRDNPKVPCCRDFPLSSSSLHVYHWLSMTNITCKCYDPQASSSLLHLVGEYHDIRCRYVFSSLKDYLVLQCSLLGLGAAVSLWMLVILLRWSTTRDKIEKQRPYQPKCAYLIDNR